MSNCHRGLFYKEETLLNDISLSLGKTLSFLTISSIFIALTGFSLPFFSFLLYDTSVDFELLLASFFITFSVYNLNKLSDTKEDSINMLDRTEFIGKYRHYLIFAMIVSSIAAIYLSFLHTFSAIVIILFPFFIGFIYSIKIANFRLKDIICIKSISVALSWAVIGTFIPLTIHTSDFIIISLIFIFVFIKLFINTVLFDVRDINSDRVSGIRTIPVFLGVNKTKHLLLFMNSTLILWIIISFKFFYRYLFVLILTIVYGYWYILHFCKEEKKIGKSLDLLVDGEFIGIAILASFIFII